MKVYTLLICATIALALVILGCYANPLSDEEDLEARHGRYWGGPWYGGWGYRRWGGGWRGRWRGGWGGWRRGYGGWGGPYGGWGWW